MGLSQAKMVCFGKQLSKSASSIAVSSLKTGFKSLNIEELIRGNVFVSCGEWFPPMQVHLPSLQARAQTHAQGSTLIASSLAGFWGTKDETQKPHGGFSPTLIW